MYTFVKGETGDQQTVPLQLLSQKHNPDWGGGWCGPTAAGISLAWFAETNPQLAKLIPGADNVAFPMAAVDGSGQFGTAILTVSGDKTLVAVDLTPAVATTDEPQPIPIHTGQCTAVGAVVHDLTTGPTGGVVGGKLTNVANATLASLMDGNHLILVHKSQSSSSIFTTCGNIPAGGNPLTVDEKYDAIGKLGELMKTSSADGTTDGNFIKGIVDYINGRGKTGDFKVKVYNHPSFREYAHELDTGDEDVLVGITYTTGDLKGKGHWLVGRSFGPKKDNGTPTDPSDDFWPVSFVDPWTGSVYHSKMMATPMGFMIWYNGQWVSFDIMISVSPVPPALKPNPDTAQYFVARNSFRGVDPATGKGGGSVIFTLLGNPDPQSEFYRTLPLKPGPNHRMILLRLKVMAVNEGVAEIRFKNPNPQGGPAVQLVKVVDGNVVPISQVMWGAPAARIVVGPILNVKVKLQGAVRPDPRGWVNMPLHVELYPASSSGGPKPTTAPAATFDCQRLSREGEFGVCTVPTNVNGFFDVFVSSARTLLHVKRGAQVPGDVAFNKALAEGNMNNDGIINIDDFTL